MRLQAGSEDQEPSTSWPESGIIELRNVSAFYEDGTQALADANLNISPGQKIGICGRTGSGKSSLLLAILRLLETHSGTICIDNTNLSIIPRSLLRSRLIAIPQDPFLFAGSVRLNADPTSSVDDHSIIAALERIELWDTMKSRGGLDVNMAEQPLSHGQPQLFCLARVILRRSKILILDEATNNVDNDTDDLMQRVMREEFAGKTIIVVAHRLNTIMDSDKIAVMETCAKISHDFIAPALQARRILVCMAQQVSCR